MKLAVSIKPSQRSIHVHNA